MKTYKHLHIMIILQLLILLVMALSGCAVNVGDKSISIAHKKENGNTSTQGGAALQTAVAATLTAVSIPTATPTFSAEKQLQTAVAATLTAVAAQQSTPETSSITPTASPTPSSKSAVATPKPTKIKTKAPPAASTPIPKPGFVLDFENFGIWKRGVQPYGNMTVTQEKVHEGENAAKLTYDFPKVNDDFVVFLKKPPAPIPDNPVDLTIWVYGDGSKHFLNVWVIDNQKEVRQFTFGQINHKDTWQPMTAHLDTTANWPQDHISGPDNGKLDYPIRLYALVLDSISNQPTNGAIYLDQLIVGTSSANEDTPQATTTTTPTVASGPLSGHIAYAVATGETTNIIILDVATGDTWTAFTYGRHPEIRNDGSLIILDGIGNGKNNLFTVHIDGSNPQQISNHTEDSYPNWSPDNARIVYYSALFGDHKNRIYIQYDIGQEPLPLKVKGMDAFGRFPIWLPNWRIAYSGCNYWISGADCGIWSVGSDGSGDPIHLTTTPSDISTDVYGNNLLYASESSGNWELYLIPITGGVSHNLTNNTAQDVAGTFSPDGHSIAFISSRGGTWAIWVMNADGSNPRKLKDVPEGFGDEWQISHISWSP